MLFALRATKVKVLLLASLGLVPSLSLAQSITIQGRVVDSGGTPVTGSGTQFRVQIMAPNAARCVLYDETLTVDLTNSNGLFSLNLNTGLGTVNLPNTYGLEDALSNRAGFAVSSTYCQSGSGTITYTPAATDNRKVVIQFRDPGSMPGFETIPEMDLNPVPYAIESRVIGGYPISSLLRVANSGVPGAAASLTSAQFSELTDLIGGTSNNYMSSSSSSSAGARLPTVSGNPSTPAAGSIWFDTSGGGSLKYYDGSTVQTVGTGSGSGDITGVTAGTGLSGGGLTGGVTLALDTSGVTAATYGSATAVPVIQVDTYGRITSATTAAISGVLPSGTSGHFLKSSGGTTWTSASITMADLKSTNSGNLFVSPGCTAAQSMYWDSGTDSIRCQNIAINASAVNAGQLAVAQGGTGAATASQNFVFAGPATGGAGAPSFRALAAADLPASASYWSAATGGINYAGGNVGVGTSAPALKTQIEISNGVSDGLRISDAGAANGRIDLKDGTATAGQFLPSLAGRPVGAARGLTLYSSIDAAEDTGSASVMSFVSRVETPASVSVRPTFQWLNNSSPQMSILANGNVGIGTTAPDTKLDLRGTTGATLKIVDGNQGLNKVLTSDANGVASWATLPTGGANPAGSGSEIQFRSSGTAFGANSNFVWDDTNSRVGIGTNAPSDKLHLYGNIDGTLGALIQNDSTGSQAEAAFTFRNGATTSGWISMASSNYAAPFTDRFSLGTDSAEGMLINATSATGNIQLMTGGTGPSNVRMTIADDGNVGIGTTAPTVSLDLRAKTDAIALPVGTNAQQPTSPVAGMIRWSTTAPAGLQVYNGSSWASLTTGGSGAYLSTGGGTLSGALTISSGGASVSGGIDNNSGGITNAGSITGVGSNITSTTGLTVASGGTDQNLALNSSGTGAVTMGGGTGTSLSVLAGPTSSVNYVTVRGAATGAAPVIGTAGSDTNINLVFTPKGSGNVGIGTTNPQYRLHVNGPLNSAAFPFNTALHDNAPMAQDNGGGLGFIGEYNSTTNLVALYSGIHGGKENATNNNWAGYLAFYTRANASSPAEAMRITSAGNVGIGTTTANAKLEVLGNIRLSGVAASQTTIDKSVNDGTMIIYGGIGTNAQPRLTLSGSSNASNAGYAIINSDVFQVKDLSNTAKVTVNSSGSVGIGTATPSLPLHLSAADTNALAYLDSYASSGGPGPRIIMRGARGAPGAVTALQANDQIFSLEGRGSYAGSFTAATKATIAAYASEAWTGSANGTYLTFSTTPLGGVNAAERMRIDAAGNVGIGTTNPTEVLDIRKAGSAFVTTTNTSASGSAGFMAATNSGVNSYNGFYSGGATSGARQKYIGNFSGTFAIGRTDDAWSANNHQLVILNNGNVGIGSATPGELLDVAGNVKATAFISTSDRRLKTNIRELNGLDLVNRMHGVRYDWRADGHPDVGVIAQEMEEVLPEAVVTDAKSGFKAVKYQNLVAPLIEAVKELFGLTKKEQSRNDEQDRRIATLERKLEGSLAAQRKAEQEAAELKKRLEALERRLGK